MIEALKAELRMEFGDDPIIDRIVDMLYEGSGMTDPTVRIFVIGREFYRLMRTTKKRSSDIELDLSVKYDMSPIGIHLARRRYVSGGKRQKSGPRKK